MVALIPILVRRERGQRQRMDSTGKLCRQRLVNQALTRDPPEPDEHPGDNDDGKMCLAALPRPAGMTDMAGVPGRIVRDVEPRWSEPLHQLAPHRVGNGHWRPARSASAAAPRNPARSSTT